MLLSQKIKKIEPFIEYALIASKEAIADLDGKQKTDDDSIKTGVMVGSGIGGLDALEKAQKIGMKVQEEFRHFLFLPVLLILLVDIFQ